MNSKQEKAAAPGPEATKVRDLFRYADGIITCNCCNCSNDVRFGSSHYTDCAVNFYMSKPEESQLPAPAEVMPRNIDDWPPESVEAAIQRICIGGEDAGIAFFQRHPHLGFAIAVYTQCELTEALAKLAESQKREEEFQRELDQATRDILKLATELIHYRAAE
jgi:hypothetical protein